MNLDDRAAERADEHTTAEGDVARATSAPVRFCVVDVETSGLSAKRHKVLQVAAVSVLEDGTITDQWCSLVRPRFRWFFRIGPRHIHGLRRHDLRQAPTLTAAMAQLQQRLDGAIFTAHNARFDAEFLAKASGRAGVALTISPALCTLQLSRKLDPQRQVSHRLADVCERYKVALDHPHDALYDALAAAAVLPHLLLAHQATTPELVYQLIGA